MDTSKPFFKAGLIGGALVIVLRIIGMIPILNCLLFPIQCIAFFALPMGIGYYSALISQLQPGGYQEGAKQGALAGILSGLIGGTTSVIIAGILLTLGITFNTNLGWIQNMNFSELASDSIMNARDLSSFLFGSICGLCINVLFYSLFGALGGLIQVHMISDKGTGPKSS